MKKYLKYFSNTALILKYFFEIQYLKYFKYVFAQYLLLILKYSLKYLLTNLIFHRKSVFFSVICKYSLKETKLRKIHFSNLIYNEYVTKKRKGAKFDLFWPFLGPKTQTPLFFFGRQVILDSQHVKLAEKQGLIKYPGGGRVSVRGPGSIKLE